MGLREFFFGPQKPSLNDKMLVRLMDSESYAEYRRFKRLFRRGYESRWFYHDRYRFRLSWFNRTENVGLMVEWSTGGHVFSGVALGRPTLEETLLAIYGDHDSLARFHRRMGCGNVRWTITERK